MSASERGRFRQKRDIERGRGRQRHMYSRDREKCRGRDRQKNTKDRQTENESIKIGRVSE